MSTPAAPTAVAGTSSITVSWAKPAPADGITGYTVSASPGPATCHTTSADDTSCVLGAEAGTAYTVTVVAHGANGVDSPASAVSAPVTPAAPATPPAPPASAPATLTTDQGRIALAAPAQRITVIGTGFAPYSTAKVIVYSEPVELGTVTADVDGNFRLPVTVPADLEVGTHTFLATGVDHDGEEMGMALPVTVPPTTISSRGDGDANHVALPVPAGGSITLLDDAGNPTTSVVIPGEGTYLLDGATGVISFVPVAGFAGTARAVSYRLADGVGSSVAGVYTAIVTRAASAPPADPPIPPGAGRPGITPVSRVVARRGRATVTCTLAGAAIDRCATSLQARVSGRLVTVGRSRAARAAGSRKRHALRTQVRLDARGRALVARPGGVRLTARAAVTQRGLNARLIARRPLIVVAQRFTLPRAVRFASRSAVVRPADRRYLAAVRARLRGPRSVTCAGNTDRLGRDNERLGRRRAVAVCRLLAGDLPVRQVVVTHADRRPRASNRTARGRALNRRTTITLGY